MTLNKFCPVAQGEYYNNKSPDKSQLFFTYFFHFFLHVLQYHHKPSLKTPYIVYYIFN